MLKRFRVFIVKVINSLTDMVKYLLSLDSDVVQSP